MIYTLLLSILRALDRIVSKYDPKRIYQHSRGQDAVDMLNHAPPDRLKAYAAAYIDYTNLPPDETVLVEWCDEDSGKWKWYFAPRVEELDE